jgi:hypothetical protein
LWALNKGVSRDMGRRTGELFIDVVSSSRLRAKATLGGAERRRRGRRFYSLGRAVYAVEFVLDQPG